MFSFELLKNFLYFTFKNNSRDEECEQYAGMCHIQMAKINEKLGDWSMQYSHYLKAARCFKNAEMRNYEMNIFGAFFVLSSFYSTF